MPPRPATAPIGDLIVNRLGYGAMRITGKGIWGAPADRPEALRALRRLPEIGVNFIDTADSLRPVRQRELIAEALHPYDGMLIATKGGLTRPGPAQWAPLGRPEYLRQCVLMSLRPAQGETHRPVAVAPHRPQDPARRTIRRGSDMQREGLIRHVGLSQVSVEEIKAAQAYFPVVTVQNRYNLVDRADEAVLDYCAANGIGFIPWNPLAAGDLTRPGGALDAIATKLGATPGQIALAWVLKRSPAMLPIPGTGRVSHLEENVAAAAITLSRRGFRRPRRAGAIRR